MTAVDLLIVLIGFVIGILAGVIGVGGGIFLVPLMVLGFRFDQHTAQGTSLAAILPGSISGGVTHGRRGNVLWREAAWMSAGGVVGAVIGSFAALLLPKLLLARVFGAFLLFAAYRMWPRRENVEKTDADPA